MFSNDYYEEQRPLHRSYAKPDQPKPKPKTKPKPDLQQTDIYKVNPLQYQQFNHVQKDEFTRQLQLRKKYCKNEYISGLR